MSDDNIERSQQGVMNSNSGENSEPPECDASYKTTIEDVKRDVSNLVTELGQKNLFYKNLDLYALKLIPPFDPDCGEQNVDGWLQKIEQLGRIHGWSDEMKSFFLQLKLEGKAKIWFNNLQSYDRPWDAWKSLMQISFPRLADFSTLLEQMMARKKQPDESMNVYFREKLMLCSKCRMSDSAVINCIINGLPTPLQANARFSHCKTIYELYDCLLSISEDDCQHQEKSATTTSQTVNSNTNNTNALINGFPKHGNVRTGPYKSPFEFFDFLLTITEENQQQQAKSSTATANTVKSHSSDTNTAETNATETMGDDSSVITCYHCGKSGHTSRSCSLIKCFKRGGVGHTTALCQGASQSSDAPPLRTGGQSVVLSWQMVKINEVWVKACLSNLSEISFISHQAAIAMSLKIKPCGVTLVGKIPLYNVIGEVEFQLRYDNMLLLTQAVVTSVRMGTTAIFIGKSVINAKFVSPSVAGLDANFNIATVAEETLSPGINLVKVRVVEPHNGKVFVKPSFTEIGSKAFSVSASIILNGEGFIKVYNTCDNEIKFPEGEVIALGKLCEQFD